jgi:hypothetical protein
MLVVTAGRRWCRPIGPEGPCGSGIDLNNICTHPYVCASMRNTWLEVEGVRYAGVMHGVCPSRTHRNSLDVVPDLFPLFPPFKRTPTG